MFSLKYIQILMILLTFFLRSHAADSLKIQSQDSVRVKSGQWDDTVFFMTTGFGAFGGFLYGNKKAGEKGAVFSAINNESVKYSIIGALSGFVIGYLLKSILTWKEKNKQK